VFVLLFGAAVSTSAAARSSGIKAINLPGGGRGIGFDDLAYARAFHLLIVPAGQTGSLDLITPGSGAVTAIPHVTGVHTSARGHWEGTTSAAYGRGYFFASDRDANEVVVIDAGTKAIMRRVKLESGPDYVRYLASVHELWVTEPHAKQIQVFAVRIHPEVSLVNKTRIAVPGGPESLAVDEVRGRAYTNLWTDRTMVIDIRAHRVVEKWPNTCKGARGSALDEKSGFLFIGCSEGKAVALDSLHDGRVLSSAATGKGVDIIAYNPALHHLYVPGADSATLTILDVDGSGHLTPNATLPVARGSHCVVTDDDRRVYVCDPAQGRLLLFKDADLRR
jgi:DNA-binding beta-propeller fold protein YncE